MDQNVETATSYYNSNRRKSFFLSRLFVLISMLVLVVTLSINVAILYSQQRTSTTTQASGTANQNNLPDLPKGCEYQTKQNGVEVVCPTGAPEASPTLASNPKFPINVELPELPETCTYAASNGGFAVNCSTPNAIIPTAAVRTVTSCQVGTEKDTLICREVDDQKVVVPLPSLPEGCEYQVVARNYFVSCKASKVTLPNQ